jgi:hypothetical protein
MHLLAGAQQLESMGRGEQLQHIVLFGRTWRTSSGSGKGQCAKNVHASWMF